jgi:hypothetical protein
MRLPAIAPLLFASAAAAQEMEVAGHSVSVAPGVDGGQALVVDGEIVMIHGLVLLDAVPQVVNGVTVVTGVAGLGGNACNAAPFVLALPAGAGPALSGPVDTCAYLEMTAGPATLVFTGTATPETPAEVWVWAPETGFAAGAPQPFAPDAALGWDNLAALDGAHPIDALRLATVEADLKTAFGPDWPAFTERLSGLGSGTLTAEGYLGEACIKFTCETDWALLYLHARSRRAYAVWSDGSALRLSPPDPGLWPEEAAAALRVRTGS